jgi:hypothetical protein
MIPAKLVELASQFNDEDTAIRALFMAREGLEEKKFEIICQVVDQLLAPEWDLPFRINGEVVPFRLVELADKFYEEHAMLCERFMTREGLGDKEFDEVCQMSAILMDADGEQSMRETA